MRWMLGFGVVTLLTVAAASGQVAGPAASVSEQYLFAMANAERAERGLPALHWDPALYSAATPHAHLMAQHQAISHQFAGEPELTRRGREAGARFSVIAENVAEAPTAVRIHDAWMHSPEHRANLLDPRLNSVAIRVERRQGQLYAVQDFGRSVAMLTLEEQEHEVSSLLEQTVPLRLLLAAEDARRTCSMESGYAGQRRPGFVMRYTTGDLAELPRALKTELASGRFREAAVGACQTQQANFSAFTVAVLLYP